MDYMLFQIQSLFEVIEGTQTYVYHLKTYIVSSDLGSVKIDLLEYERCAFFHNRR